MCLPGRADRLVWGWEWGWGCARGSVGEASGADAGFNGEGQGAGTAHANDPERLEDRAPVNKGALRALAGSAV